MPFTGAGFGYNTGAGQLNATATVGTAPPCPLAFLPNHPANQNPPGGANSDYTAPDCQHMFLAAQTPFNPTIGDGRLSTPIPSLHRPELVNYFANGVSPSNPTFDGLWQQNQALCRAIMMRPIGQYAGTITSQNSLDHPHFTGSNLDVNGQPAFNPMWDGFTPTPTNPKSNGLCQWDVDNDGDGIPDSIWVDLAAPVRTINSRTVKPLYALLCVDLDGRLNLNAHGCLAQSTIGPNNQTYFAAANVQTDLPMTTPPLGGAFSFASSAPTGSGLMPLARDGLWAR